MSLQIIDARELNHPSPRSPPRSPPSRSVGVFFYIWGLTRPIYHALWHVFVLFASAFHYFAIYYYVEPCDVQNVLPGMRTRFVATMVF